MDNIARVLVLTGLAVAILGVVLWAGARLGLGRLPGDIFVDHGNVKIAVPIVTSLILSLILTVVLNVVIRLSR